MQLTYGQKQHLLTQGYVQIPGVVPPVMVGAAVKAINNSLGKGLPPDQMTKFSAQTFCPELTSTSVITDLFNRTPARELAESAIGEGKINPVGHGQIALRFPTMQDPPPAPRPHIDGMYSPTNGVPEGEIQNFTALVGIYLSDVAQEFAGNFTVWPGSHTLHERYFREHGPQSLLNGMPPVDMPAPLQVKGRPGDALLVHYALGHAAAINISPNTRYAIFFRLKHIAHDSHKFETMTDLWLDWEGMRDIL